MNEKISGKVVELKIDLEKGKPVLSTDSITAIADKGIERDRHSKGGKRQVSIVTKEAREWVEEQSVRGFCIQKFNENIVVEGMDFINIGSDLIFSEVILKISEIKNICFSDCPRIMNALSCKFKEEHCFAEVIRGGKIKVGEEFRVFDHIDIGDINRNNITD